MPRSCSPGEILPQPSLPSSVPAFDAATVAPPPLSSFLRSPAFSSSFSFLLLPLPPPPPPSCGVISLSSLQWSTHQRRKMKFRSLLPIPTMKLSSPHLDFFLTDANQVWPLSSHPNISLMLRRCEACF